MNNSTFAIFANDQNTIQKVVAALIIAGYNFSYSYDTLLSSHRVDLDSEYLTAATQIAEECEADYMEI